MSKMGDTKRAALVEAFHEALKQAPSVSAAMAAVATAPAPRFYLTPDRALRLMWEVKRGRLTVKNPQTVARAKELYQRWQRALKRGEESYEAILRIVEEPAPSFYIEPATLSKVIYAELRRRRKNYGKKIGG